jgi:hypothetical protein
VDAESRFQAAKAGAELGKKAGVHWNTVSAIELGKSSARPETLKAIQRALEKAGVEFTNGKRPGVRAPTEADATELDNDCNYLLIGDGVPCAVTGSPPGTGEAPRLVPPGLLHVGRLERRPKPTKKKPQHGVAPGLGHHGEMAFYC